MSLFQDQRNIEKSVADATDKLSFVDPDKILQFSDTTYTEATNIAFILAESKSLKRDAFPPFTEKRLMPSTARGTSALVEKEVPLTYGFGEDLDGLVRDYLQLKISMRRESRREVKGVAQSFGSGQAEQRQGWLARAGSWVKGKFN